MLLHYALFTLLVWIKSPRHNVVKICYCYWSKSIARPSVTCNFNKRPSLLCRDASDTTSSNKWRLTWMKHKSFSDRTLMYMYKSSLLLSSEQHNWSIYLGFPPLITHTTAVQWISENTKLHFQIVLLLMTFTQPACLPLLFFFLPNLWKFSVRH